MQKQDTMKQLLFLCMIALAGSCQTDPFNGRDFSKITGSQAFAAGKKTGAVQGLFAEELSGLAASQRTPGAYWVHNDGKKVTEIYLIDSLGAHLATLKLPLSKTQDCEDIALGIDSDTGIPYIYLADLGDNNRAFGAHFIYRIPEPALPAHEPFPVTLTAENLETISFQYPDGAHYNAETLLFDPRTQDLYVMTKAHGGATLFRLAHKTGNTSITAERLGNFPIDLATAGDVSPDGSEVLIKTKKKIYYWKVPAAENLGEALLKNNPELVPYEPETQGEAICFNRTNTGFLTSTERAKAASQPIFYFARQ